MTDLDTFRLLGLVIFKALFDKSRIPSALAVLASNTLHWARIGLLGLLFFQIIFILPFGVEFADLPFFLSFCDTDDPSKIGADITEFDQLAARAYSSQLKGRPVSLV